MAVLHFLASLKLKDTAQLLIKTLNVESVLEVNLNNKVNMAKDLGKNGRHCRHCRLLAWPLHQSFSLTKARS